MTLLAAVLLAAVIFSLSPPAGVQAAPLAGSADELIQAVNAYRASYGLEAYQIDGGLMSLAQSHSEYQASIGACTHTRADGSGPAAYGISAENVACGLNLTVDGAIYGQWADGLHNATMIGPDQGLVGAGVAESEGMVYYTLAVKRISGSFTNRAPLSNETASDSSGASLAQVETATSEPYIGPVAVSTPNEDGSISHIIKYGETIETIAAAYGVTPAELIAINRLDERNPIIYEGQPLLIRLAFTPTPFMTATNTERPPTRTPAPSRTPKPTRTPTPERTLTPTMTATPEPLVDIPTIEDLGPIRPVIAYAFIGISAVGLIFLIWTSFWPGKDQ